METNEKKEKKMEHANFPLENVCKRLKTFANVHEHEHYVLCKYNV